MSDEKFDGRNRSDDPFDPEERKRIRHMLEVLSEEYREMSESQHKTLDSIDVMRRAWPLMLSAIAAAVILKQYGIL